MSKERALIKDMKILLECTDMGGLQRNADVLIGRAIELLAQQEPEPVAWMHCDGDSCCTNNTKLYGGVDKGYSVPLYASPPTREPLSDKAIWTANTEQIFEEGVRWAEQQHKIGVGDE